MNNTPRLYLAAAIITVVVAFYIYATLSSRTPSAPRFDVHFTRFTGAEQLRSARSPELIEEVHHLIDQNGLPADVFQGLSPLHADATEDERLRQETRLRYNIASTLHDLLGQFYESDPDNANRPLRDDLQQLWEASPIGAWYIDWQTNPVGILDVNQEKMGNVRQQIMLFETTRQSIRDRLDQPRTLFYYMFDRSADAKSYTGTNVNTIASRYLADYALFEEYNIARALLEGDIDEAVDSLSYIFRIAYLGSRLADVGVRADAAVVRLRAYDVMQRVVLDPKFERHHMVDLRNMLTEQYQNWTPEYTAWFGDRASGLMLYRRIMVQGATDALTQNDLNELEQRGLRTVFNRNFRQNHESDTVFYLQAMQKILDVSKKNYADRGGVLDQIDRDLQIRRNSHNDAGVSVEPVVASILLRDIDRLLYLFAQDQSALTRALVAVLNSLGQRNTGGYRNPLTNEQYTVRQVDGYFQVETPELPRPFRVPIFAPVGADTLENYSN